MSAMSTAQINAFLHEIRHAIVATQRRDGSPQLSSVWYLWDNGTLYVSVTTNTAKYHNVRRAPRISVSIDGGHPDARTVVLYGTAELIEPDQPQQEQLRERIIRRYKTDEEEAREYIETVRDTPAAIIVLRPDKILSWDFN